jgi:hypothetical protein
VKICAAQQSVRRGDRHVGMIYVLRHAEERSLGPCQNLQCISPPHTSSTFMSPIPQIRCSSLTYVFFSDDPPMRNKVGL